MSAYHATHPSPYDDACPDCTGFAPEADHYTTTRRQARAAAALAFIALGVLAGLLILWGGNR